MEYTIEGGQTFPIVKVNLKSGETLKAESGAMVALSQNMELRGKVEGGLKKAIGRVFSGESFFLQSIEAAKGDGWALLSTSQLGAIGTLDLNDEEWIIQKNGFVAATQDLDITTKVQSLAKGLLSGEGFFIIRMKGTGTAFLSTYGALQYLDIPEGETVLVDNGHLVAWPAHLKYEMAKGGKGWVSSFTSGEGLACRFFGPGRVIIQTRNPKDFGQWIQQFLPPPPRSSN